MFLQNRTWNSHSELGNGLTTSKATYNQTMFLPKPQVQSGKSGEGGCPALTPVSTEQADWMCVSQAPF